MNGQTYGAVISICHAIDVLASNVEKLTSEVAGLKVNAKFSDSKQCSGDLRNYIRMATLHADSLGEISENFNK